ncbi:MAG: hypothetical protein RRB13_06610 [bacterium]|nr:hypothetical protein [bacterium]
MKSIPHFIWLRRSLIAVCGLLISFGSAAQAGNLKLQGGATVTTQVLPLAGFSAALGYEADGFFGFGQEVTLFYHNLTGQGNLSEGAVSSDVQVDFNSWEIGYFMPYNLGRYTVGPGIGYGVASTTEKLSNNTDGLDPSPFLTGNDIHYGVVSLRASMAWGSIVCDGIGGSFGGLIGGSLLCGVKF